MVSADREFIANSEMRHKADNCNIIPLILLTQLLYAVDAVFSSGIGHIECVTYQDQLSAFVKETIHHNSTAVPEKVCIAMPWIFMLLWEPRRKTTDLRIPGCIEKKN